jgi:hypothetical protein
MVLQQEWLEFEGGVISALFQQGESALARTVRARTASARSRAALSNLASI